MNRTTLDKANVDNLTDLWRAMGIRTDLVTPGLHGSISWPDRYWFDWGAEPDTVPDDVLTQLPLRAMVPVWAGDDRNSPLQRTLERNGFTVSLVQRAMYLSLDGWSEDSDGSLAITRVASLSQVESWTDICSRAFGYRIDPAVIHRIAQNPNARLLLVRADGELVATALLYKTGPVIGVHQLGVLPEQRGKGIAGALMRDILAACREWRGRLITLQASTAGEGLYRKLGFEPQFNIATYRRADFSRT